MADALKGNTTVQLLGWEEGRKEGWMDGRGLVWLFVQVEREREREREVENKHNSPVMLLLLWVQSTCRLDDCSIGVDGARAIGAAVPKDRRCRLILDLCV